MVDAQPMKIFLLAALLVLAVAAPAAAETGPALAVDASPDRRAIREDIYGMNFADPVLAREIGLPVDPRSIRADRRGRLTLALLPRDEAGQVKVSLTLRAKVGRRTVTVGGGSYRVPGSPTTRVSVRLAAAGAAALRRARWLRIAVAALGTDAAGLRRTSTAKILVRAAARR